MRLHRLIANAILLAVLVAALIGCAPAAAPTAAPAPAQPAQPTQAAPAAPAAAPTSAPAAPAATTAPAAPAADNTLIVAMSLTDVVTLDPAYAGETTNLMIHINTYDTLVDIRPGDLTTIVPRLAEKWEVNSDFTEFIFHLRKDVKFASGNPLTSADVVFSWNRLMNVAGAPAFNLDGVGKVEAVDPYSVKVSTSIDKTTNKPTPLPQFLSSACNPSLGIQDSKLVMEHGGTAAANAKDTDKAKQWLDQNSAGSGPYVLTKWSPKAEIDLEVNKNYWKTAPYFSKVIIKNVEDPTTQIQMLQKGDADFVPQIDTDLVDIAKSDPNITITVDQSLDENYLAMTSSCKTKQSPDSAAALCKKEVRHAVVDAIDYDGVIKAVLSGYGTRAPSIIPLGVLGVDPAKVWGRDLAKSKDLLKTAGYANGLKLDLYYAQNSVRDTVAAKLKSDLAEAGIDLTLKPLEQSVYLTQMRAQELPMAFGGWTPDYLDVTMWTDYFGLGDRSVALRMQYKNPAATALAEQIRTTADVAVRKTAVEKLQDILIDDMPYTMLYQRQYVNTFRTGLKGFAYDPVWLVDFSQLSK